MSPSLHVCTGPLPAIIGPLPGTWVVRVHGCAIHSPTAGAPHELVLTLSIYTLHGLFRRSTAALMYGYYRQSDFWKAWPGTITVASFSCSPPAFLTHAVSLRCTTSRLPARLRVGCTVANISAQAVLGLSNSRLQVQTGHIVTVSTAMHGPSSLLLRRVSDLVRTWSAVGVRRAFMFTRSAQLCATLESTAIPSILCETRAAWSDGILLANASVNAKFAPYDAHPFFDQGVHMLVALSYARAAGESDTMIAFTDIDEVPSPNIRHIFARLARDPLAAGALVFFDAAFSCPEGFCPTSKDDHVQRCPFNMSQRTRIREGVANGGASASPAKLACWKPVVVARRVSDLRVHDFTPAARRHGWLDRLLLRRRMRFNHLGRIWGHCLAHLAGGLTLPFRLPAAYTQI